MRRAYTRDVRSPLLALLLAFRCRDKLEITLSRAVAARLRLIDFFDERTLTAVALPFSDETRDRDRENRDAGSVLERVFGRKKKRGEARRGERRSSAFLAPDLARRSCCVTHESIERRVCRPGQDNNDKVREEGEKKNKGCNDGDVTPLLRRS